MSEFQRHSEAWKRWERKRNRDEERAGAGALADRDCRGSGKFGTTRVLRPLTRECENVLVLTVKQGGFIRIGDNIDVVIDRFKGGAVVVGIEAPRDVKIVRGELVPDSSVQRDRDCGKDGKA
jgi:carbon storage regulator CsrA